MPLKTSKQGRDFIKSHEGEILEVYLDPVGLPTVGVGHLITPEEKPHYPVGRKITKAQSDSLLARDLKRFEDCVNRNVLVSLNQNEFDALVSFAFNVGEANFKKSSVLRNLNRGRRQKAADSLLLWNKSKGRVLKGLTRRRNEERDLFLTPSAAAEAHPSDKRTESANPTPESASEPSVQQQTIFNKSVGWLADKKAKLDSIGVDPGQISLSSRVKIAIQYVIAGILAFAAWVKENPIEAAVYASLAVAVIVLAGWIFSKAKQNATTRVVNGVK